MSVSFEQTVPQYQAPRLMWHYRGGTRVFSHSTGAVSLEHMRSSQKFTLECTGRKAAGSGKGTGCKLLIAVQFLLVGQLNPSNKEASVPCHIGRITWKVTSPQGTASLCPGSQSSSVPAASSVAAGKGYQTPNLSVCLSRMSVPAPKLNMWTRAPTGLKHFKCISSECCYVTFAGRYTHTNTSEITFVCLGTPQPTTNAAFGPQGNLLLPCSQLVQGGDA